MEPYNGYTGKERDAKDRKLAAEARARKAEYAWKPIEGRPVRQGWWDYLTLDPESKVERSARPRP